MSDRRPSATILRFVPRGRKPTGPSGRHHDDGIRAQQAASLDAGEAWYHAAAIRDEARKQPS